MYQKRSKMPKIWPIPRKSKKQRYVVIASHAKTKSIPLLVVLRDILKIAQTKKEVRQFVLRGDVKVNNKIRTDEKFPVQVFDVINLEKAGKNYRLDIVSKKLKLTEVSGKETERKIVKILGKKVLKKNKIQINLEDGQNFLVKENFSVGDSVVINTKDTKIEKVLPLKEGSNVEIISGKHAGEKGVLKKIEKFERRKRYLIKLKDKEVELPLKTILVIE